MASHEVLSVDTFQDYVDACSQHVAQADTLTVETAAARLDSAIEHYVECVAAKNSDADECSQQSQEATAISIMMHMQRFSLLCCAARATVFNLESAPQCDTRACIEKWERWLLGLESQSIALASQAAVFLPPLQACWQSGAALDDAHSSQMFRIDEAIDAFFSQSARRCAEEWRTYGTPLCTLLPPLALLTTFARFRWAWGRFVELRHVVSGRRLGTPQVSDIVARSTETLREQKREVVDFLEMTCEVEKSHTTKIAREVLLHSFKTIDWKTSNAVPTVRGVAPLVWSLFLRCRSYALRAQSQSNTSSDFFAYEASARLVSELLRCTVDGVSVCLDRQASVMHESRVMQLCVCDIPCLILLTRLWFSWIALSLDSATVLLPALDHSLRRLVFSTVKLNSLSNGKTRAQSAIPPLEGGDYSETIRTPEERLFLQVAWKTAPLSLSEIMTDAAGLPWTAEFPRAKEMQVILAKKTVVALIP